MLTRKIMEQVMNMHMNEFSMKTVKQKPIKIGTLPATQSPGSPQLPPRRRKAVAASDLYLVMWMSIIVRVVIIVVV